MAESTLLRQQMFKQIEDFRAATANTPPEVEAMRSKIDQLPNHELEALRSKNRRLSEFSGIIEGDAPRAGSIAISIGVIQVGNSDYSYHEQINDVSTTYKASTLDELLSKVGHMLLASAVVRDAIHEAERYSEGWD